MPCRINLSRIFRANSGANASRPCLSWAWPAFCTKDPKSLQTLETQALSFSLESGSLCLNPTSGIQTMPTTNSRGGRYHENLLQIGESSMNAATASEIARLKTLTITQIVRQFESLFGEKCRSRNKRYLIRRIAWRLQANAEGDLSERARARAAELALDSEVRVTPPRETIQPRLVTSDVQSRPALDQRLPPPGSMLHRDYKGRQIRVLIVNNGFEYEGQLYKSLTAVANAITGSHVNGFQFFGLGRRR